MIIYTDNRKLVPEPFGAVTRGPVIFVHESQRDNMAIISHEKAHRLQWWLTLGLSPLLYKVWPSWRMWCEVWAYRAGLKYKPDALDNYAQYLATHYNLKINKAQAKRMLSK